MMFLYAFLIVAAVAAPLLVIYHRVRTGHRGKAPLVTNLCAFFGVMVCFVLVFMGQGASAVDAAEVATDAVAASNGLATGLGYIGAALAVGLCSLGGGIAVAASASAALGALSENETLFGKSLIFVGLAEGLALYGLLIGFMIISKL
jgi:V/A-type H+-transporting ATPase subunit K